MNLRFLCEILMLLRGQDIRPLNISKCGDNVVDTGEVSCRRTFNSGLKRRSRELSSLQIMRN